MDINPRSVGAILLPFVGGFGGSLIQKKNMDTFYRKTLKKPWFTPPELAFPVVWSSLYASMGYASYLVFRDGGGFDGAARTPLAIYGAHLAVNWAFTPLFFGWKQLGWAAVDCAVLWLGVAITMKSFYSVNQTAGLMLIPYQAWVTLATALSYSIWRDNPRKIK